MKKNLILTAVLAMLGAVNANAGKVVTDSLSSTILNADVKFNVYLPDGYGKSEKQYPVVYLLHGLYGTYDIWETQGRMQLVADELIASGEADEMVIIMPNAGGADVRNIHNGYFNVPGWNYEDFFFQELMPQVEKKYHCIGDREHRAIMGLSMGGGGSAVYAQKHPELFSSCYAMSAWLDTSAPDPKQEKNCFYYTCLSVNENSALKFVDNADAQTIQALNSVRWFLDCGDDDSLVVLSEQLHIKMRTKRINCELRVRNGVHNWEYWHSALRLALPFASRNFDRIK